MKIESESTATYSMHPIIEKAYSELIKKYSNDPIKIDFKNFGKNKASKALERPDPIYAAFNLYYYFPTHYFKACHALQNDSIIGLKKLSAWLRYNPFLSIIDVGCGDGAGSVAVLDAILRLREKKEIDPRPIHLYFVGVDPNENGLSIYEDMIDEIRKNLEDHEIYLQYNVSLSTISQAAGEVDSFLYEEKKLWNQPSLSHTLAIASNLTDLLEIEHTKEQEKIKSLRSYKKKSFGKNIAAFYRHIFEAIPIDHLHMITIDTEPEKIRAAVEEMSMSIQESFTERKHIIENNEIKLEEIKFENPKDSYYREKRGFIDYKLSPFIVSVCNIDSEELTLDGKWQKITSQENLELAWSRARQEMLRSSLSDEIELRLFDNDLGANLDRLKFELNSYAIQLRYISDTLIYAFPKSIDNYRPKGLTWLESEIIMIAIIQVIGENILQNNPHSYAYRLSPENSPERGSTEYLYERWVDAWKTFRQDIKEYADKFPEGRIFETDIKSFFKQIIQNNINNLVTDELNIGRRIEWLISLFIKKEIPNHESGKGLVQGSVGSGFWANLYLIPVDNLFTINDAKKRRLFRYVDDIVVVIPNNDDVENSRELVASTISGVLGLELNSEKTDIFNVKDYVIRILPDDLVDQLQCNYEKLVDSLFQMDGNLRSQFRACSDQTEFWWLKISRYQSCLTELGLYITMSSLSREITKILIKDDGKLINDLQFPNLPIIDNIDNSIDWANEFRNLNSNWNQNVNELKDTLSKLFRENLLLITNSQEIKEEPTKVIASRRFRYAANRLSVLGLDQVHSELTSFLCETPWIFHDHKFLIEFLARQEYSSDIWKLIYFHFNNSRDIAPYLCAIALRAVRFLPHLDLSDWNKLVNFMFVDNILIKLMASETWIAINSKSNTNMILHSDLIREKIKSVFEKDYLEDRRILKNYLLILGMIDSQEILRLGFNYQSDPLVSKAYLLAKTGQSLKLFNNAEPDIIRQKYYSNKYRHFDDGGEVPIS